MRWWWLTIWLVLGFVGQAEAVDRYVRAGATGANNGTDWTNAYTSLATAETNAARGDLVYVGCGTYGSVTFNTAASGTQTIEFRRATAADHGAAADWQASYECAQIAIGYLTFTTPYWIVDGNTNVHWSHGFKIPATTGAQAIIMQGLSGNTGDNVTIRDLEIDCTNCASTGTTPRGIYINGADNTTLENVWVHHTYQDCVKPYAGNTALFDHFWCSDRQFSPDNIHGDSLEIVSFQNLTVRHSRFDWDGQQLFFGGDVVGANNNAYFYGNLHYGGASSGQGISYNSGATNTGGTWIYNNTFYGLNTYMIESGVPGISAGAVRNNIFWAEDQKSVNVPNMNYNLYSSDATGYTDANAQIISASTPPFVNASSEDFRLSAATNAGDNTLGSPYNVDPFGNTRGSDGTWDRGAYEFVASAGSATQLIWSTQFSGCTGAVACTTQGAVRIADASGATVTSATNPITITVISGPSGGVLSNCAANPATPSSGVATFSGCRFNKVGTYVLRASSTGSGLTEDDSADISVTVSAPTNLRFITQPSNGEAGTALTSQPSVGSYDAGGNLVTTATDSVTLTLNTCTGLQATANPLTEVNGVAQFAGVRVTNAGTGCTLTASATGRTSATSQAFTISAVPETSVKGSPVGGSLGPGF